MKTLTILASVLILSACSSMSPFEKENEKMESTAKTQESSIKELEDANKVLGRHIGEMKK